MVTSVVTDKLFVQLICEVLWEWLFANDISGADTTPVIRFTACSNLVHKLRHGLLPLRNYKRIIILFNNRLFINYLIRLKIKKQQINNG